MSRYRAQILEVINRNVVVSLALEQGFNAFLPVYDGGVDFILYREADGAVRKVQLKGRWMIDKKYVGRDIWVAFPIWDDWYLMPHDLMLEHAEADGKTLKSASWLEGGRLLQAEAVGRDNRAVCALQICSDRSNRVTGCRGPAMNDLVRLGPSALPEIVTVCGERAGIRFLEFFASTLRNPHTRRAYARAVADFLAWCEDHGVSSIAAIQPLHVAAWIEGQIRERSAPTVKQQLAALRHLFDWLVVGQVVPLNPAASVRGPAHSVRNGKTPVRDPAEARALLDSIDASTPIGLRDRALIALMVFSFARVGAALAIRVEDVFVQNRRLWVRLREKGGKRHEMPCHHTLEEYLHAYLDGVRIGDDPKGPLFRTRAMTETG